VDHLTSRDLEGLDKLKIFDVSYNPITRLHKDYFVGHPTLEIISFYDCSLMYIENGVLDPLVNLKEGHFEFNICVNYRGDHESKIDNLKKEIKGCEESTGSSPLPDASSEEVTERQTKVALTATKISEQLQPKPAEGGNRDDSFVRRNAVAIIVFLLVIIVALAGFMYKINAFNRQNWR
jgi:predicted DNA-binding antitoxin AbrB/MazE fold protein